MSALITDPQRHQAAVARLRASYEAIPAGQPVRLAKRTSNLFRPRTALPAAGLDVAGLNGVISVDAEARTADVQGMCTYENLVDATLPYGLMPLVVPQLRTITLGGAVTGLGIESSSFRNGLPHESVLELDVLTGAGTIVTASPTQHPDLFRGFPNSYGSLGYAVRLQIALQPVKAYVALRHVRFDDLDDVASAIGTIASKRSWDGEEVEFLDGVMFGPKETYLTLGRFVDWPREADTDRASDYTGQQVYFRSVRERSRDLLSTKDYLWRWDTDWFWCSGAFGAQNPILRRLWPARYRRSDVYHKLLGFDQKVHVGARLDRLKGIGARERVVQDVEIPLDRTPEFLRWFADNVPMSPVWLCPLKLYDAAKTPTTAWPLYPLEPGEIYVNVGFWGTVVIADGQRDGDMNRLIEDAVARVNGHKSLYSDAYYERASFDALYGGEVYRELKDSYDPGHRLTGMYEKAVGRR
ncbi:FAD-binding oxidoreductase [Jatrophihabitans telluris]|uniref:Delta(24)-sterol reductase n=1 Tax=Jatrophihabitans telluris TaxID=2038343 RepID=A0ABY4R3T7_9ACTN|nr:FAD-binding oxidoreductase [Jatrophihabitans telluris]UQX89649.1 FAD-binding oxidoreductase [Jatrophihabitans telluris]